MSVETTSNRETYSTDGSTKVWDYTFPLISATDIQVYVVDPAGFSTQITSNFSVDIVNSQVTYPVTGSALANDGSQIILLRSVPLTQEETLTTQGPFPAASLNLGYDKLTMIAQQLQEQIDRSFIAPVGTVTPSDYLLALDAAVTMAQAAEAGAIVAETSAQGSAVAAAASAAGINFTKDNDGTMAANSDSVVPSQKAVRTYVAAATPTGVLGDGTVGLSNLLQNGDFENWGAGASTSPDWWIAVGGAIARDSGTVKQGTYSCKFTSSAGDYVRQYVHTTKGIDYWKGRSVTFSGWVYATAGSRASLQIADGVGSTNSSFHTGDSTWQRLSVTRIIDSSATNIQLLFNIAAGSSLAFYFDGADAYEGSSQFANTPHPNDSHKSKVLNTTYDISVTGALSITGVGFTPKSCFMVATINTTQIMSVSLFDFGNQFCVTRDYAGATIIGNTCASIYPSAGTIGYLSFTSFDTDGITFNRTKTSTPTGTVNIALTFFG